MAKKSSVYQKGEKKGETRGVGRSCNWATVVYPDSVPYDEMIEKISDLHMEALISPLHDSDINATGEKKKSHFHIVLMFSSVKTDIQAREITESFGGVGLERIGSLRGMARYLCHLDNPEKAQYKIEDVRELGGADYRGIISLPSDLYLTLIDIIDFCDRERMYNFANLVRWCRKNNEEWFRTLVKGGVVFIKEFMKTASYDIPDLVDNCGAKPQKAEKITKKKPKM